MAVMTIKIWIPVLLGLQFYATALGTSESLYQCTHSMEQTGQVYTPNIPDFYFNDMNAANFRTGPKANLTAARNGTTYIFPIPSESPLRNCNGTVVSLQYCYQARNRDIGMNQSVFNILSLVKNGLDFSVSNKIQITTSPRNRICTQRNQQQIICCDNTSLQPTDRFEIPPTNYSFGVVVGNRRSFRPLAFVSSAMEYRAEQYQASLGVNGPSRTFTLTDTNHIQSSSLLLLRFFIATTAMNDNKVPTPTTQQLATSYWDQPEVNISSLLRCQSSDRSGLVYTPNIPDFYFNVTNAAAFSPDSRVTNRSTFIFTINSESLLCNCNGTVVSFQYCYQARNGDIGNIIFLSLAQNGMQVRVKNRITIKTTPQNNKCIGDTVRTCCVTEDLQPRQRFKITSSMYSFSVVINGRRPLSFTTLATENHLKQYQVPVGMDTRMRFTLSEDDRLSNPSFILLRFLIDTDVATTEKINTDVSGALVGGITGGFVAVLVLMSIIVCGVIVVIKYQLKQQSGMRERDGMGFGNAAYYTGGDEYAGSGPRVSFEGSQETEVEGRHEYYYADGGISYEVPLSSVEMKNSSEIKSIDDEAGVYLVPATEENELHSQLKNIVIQDLFRDSIKLGKLLGSGQFGMVYKGLWESPKGQMEVAVKTLKEGSGEEDRVKFLQEAAIMGQFKHHNVVETYGLITDGEPVLLILELLEKGDLRNHLLHMRSDEEAVNVDDHTLLSYCRQVASGMAYLSNKAFIHRDLAARNILVSEDEICKIADFGMSRDLIQESHYISRGGMIPIKWTAPEALHYKTYSSASDVWSYGVLMYEIWSVGHKPYENYEMNRVIKIIDTGFRLPPSPGCPRALYDIMISCWHPVASQRPNFSDVSRKLSLPDTKLLQWSEEDGSVHPEATKLGADLLCGQELYKDLQTRYQ